jgi:hypothetical protein
MTASSDEPVLGPPPAAPSEFLLEAKALAVAMDAVARLDPPAEARVERRAYPARKATTEWNPIHLRLVREQPIAVYDPLGEIEVTLDPAGKIVALDDPRHAPTTDRVHTTEDQAVARVAFLMGVAPADVELEAEVSRKGGVARLLVRNKGTLREAVDKGKFFKREAEAPEGPPPDRIEADLNAATGRIFRFRREPAPPAEAPK